MAPCFPFNWNYESDEKKKIRNGGWNAHTMRRPTRNSIFFLTKFIFKSILFDSVWFGYFFLIRFSYFEFVTFKRLNGPSFDFICFTFSINWLVWLDWENNWFTMLIFFFFLLFCSFQRIWNMKEHECIVWGGKERERERKMMQYYFQL